VTIVSSLRDRILSADDIGRKIVHVEEWEVDVEVRTMTAGKRAEMMRAAVGSDGNIDPTMLWPMVIIATAYDPETGDALFTSTDMEVLKNKSAGAIEFLGGEAMAMSGMGGGDIDEAGKES
jgi:hypothetical protein